MLQRLAEIVRALAELIEQARVLNRDDGLIGEGFDKGNFSGVERSRLLGSSANRADDRARSNHWSRNY